MSRHYSVVKYEPNKKNLETHINKERRFEATLKPNGTFARLINLCCYNDENNDEIFKI
jgi:hypothetical protein